MKTQTYISSIIAVCIIALFSGLAGCKSDDHDHDHDDHGTPGIVTLTLRDTANATSVLTAVWRDMDGAGGANPTIDTLRLQANKVYNGTITITATDNSDLTPTIRSEADEHQFFFGVSGNAAGKLTIIPTDKDSKNLPIGLAFRATTAAAAAGTFTVSLFHYDDVAKDGVAKSPETDVECLFPVVIQ
ncbi:MAG: hypothetical protein JNL32_10430 [Candidatus Kapabacteria bacterium]|nr:hypothetical protein [Candidatus Kapabacteria bacterium]